MMMKKGLWMMGINHLSPVLSPCWQPRGQKVGTVKFTE